MKRKAGRAARRSGAAGGKRGAAHRPRGPIAVDVGNSDTVVGWFEGRELQGFWRLSSGRQTTDELVLTLRSLLGKPLAEHRAGGIGAVLCSVVPALTLPWSEALERVAGRAPVEVSAATASDLPIRYHDRAAVGADRIANAVAARGLYGTPAIVVDLG